MPETINDLDLVTLVHEFPEEGLPAGQVGTVVFVHNNGEAFEVEFVLEPRRSVVATVRHDLVMKLKGLEVLKTAS